jgi:hypothetical protein
MEGWVLWKGSDGGGGGNVLVSEGVSAAVGFGLYVVCGSGWRRGAGPRAFTQSRGCWSAFHHHHMMMTLPPKRAHQQLCDVGLQHDSAPLLQPLRITDTRDIEAAQQRTEAQSTQ